MPRCDALRHFCRKLSDESDALRQLINRANKKWLIYAICQIGTQVALIKAWGSDKSTPTDPGR